MSPVRTVVRTVAAALVTTLFIACNAILGNESEYRLAPADAGAVPCTLNSDCASGKVCIFETCSAPCHEDVDCPLGSRCLDTTTKAGTACVTPDQAKCTGDACPEGTTCSGGTCRTNCSGGAGCRTDQTCSAASVCVGTNSSHDSPGGSRDGGGGRGGSGGAKGTGGGSGSGGAAGAPIDNTGPDASSDAGGGRTGAGGSADGGDAGTDLCVGTTCEVQPAAECSGTTLRTYATVGSCSRGVCTYAHTDTTCQFGCTAGKCGADPCAGVACTTPPSNKCQDGTHLTAYDTAGTCSAATCSYSSRPVACTCVNDACTTDPCATVTCNGPPTATCFDLNTRRTFATAGTCSGGSCTYAPTDTACPFGCASGACKGDPCAGVSCNVQQASSCLDALTLRTYSVPGACSAGVCSYTHVDTPCTMQCTTSGGAACTCPQPYYTGTGVGVNGCVDVNECATNNGGCGSAAFWKCTNVIGGPPTCADIDECATNNGGCGSAAFWKCTNNAGAAPTCADIDECGTNNGGCGSAVYWKCTNNAGAAPSCADIDECAANNGGCGAVTAWTCGNVAGGPQTCTNKNECTLGTNDCDTSPAAVCTDTTGSFNCTCPGNYVGTGHGVNGCTCSAEPLCDVAHQNGSYCLSGTTQVSCAAPGGCQVATSTTCKNVANEGCAGIYPNAKCEKAFGYPTDGGGSGTLGAAFLFGVPFTLTQSLTLTRLGLIARAAATGVRMAVYADSGGPAVWEASALSGTVAAGRNEYPINDPPSTTPVTLPPGTYWIVAVMQSSTSLAQGAVSSVRYKTFSPWNTPFPTGTLAPTTGDTLAQPNFYVVGTP